MKLLIEHQCPQCGAPAVLEETDRLFSCNYCRVKSYLSRNDHFRYLLPDKAPAGKDLIYMPYWRYRGILFSSTARGLMHRFIDVSYQALELQGLPVSLGLRSQALKLKFVTPSSVGRFLCPDVSITRITDMFKNQYTASLPGPVYHQAYVGDTLSMIYAPYFVNGRLYDAVLNHPLDTAALTGEHLSELDGDKARWPLDFIPALCPSCGWDLEGRRDALALLCRNCNTMWQASRTEFQPLNFATLQSGLANPVNLPFWRIKADITGLQIENYADLARLANLPRLMQSDWPDIGFRFWAPAFKLQPRAFARLCTHATLAQPHTDFKPRLPEGQVHAVTLPVEEAVDSLKINLSTFMKPARRLRPQLPHIKIRPSTFVLVYLPFEKGHHDLIQPDLNLVVNINQLRLSSDL